MHQLVASKVFFHNEDNSTSLGCLKKTQSTSAALVVPEIKTVNEVLNGGADVEDFIFCNCQIHMYIKKNSFSSSIRNNKLCTNKKLFTKFTPIKLKLLCQRFCYRQPFQLHNYTCCVLESPSRNIFAARMLSIFVISPTIYSLMCYHIYTIFHYE